MSDITQLRIAIVLCFAAAFVVSCAVTPLSMIIAKKTNFLDIPKDERRMHSKAIPTMGGLALICSFIIVALLAKELILDNFAWAIAESVGADKIYAVAIGGAIIFLLGIIDDYFDLNAWVKLLGQIGSACVVCAMGVRITEVGLFGWSFTGSTAASVAGFIITVVWLVAITNTINLIDGLDGLAAGVAAIASLSIAYVAYTQGMYAMTFYMLVLAGASAGFLPFNFYPAKVFMGDCGAMFLGFTFASISILDNTKSATLMAVIVPVLVLGVPVFDVLFAMVRRRASGKSIFSPDKGHLHHQLTRIGMGQRRTVLMLYGISGVMGVAAVSYSRANFLEAVFLILIAIVFILVLIWGWNKRNI